MDDSKSETPASAEAVASESGNEAADHGAQTVPADGFGIGAVPVQDPDAPFGRKKDGTPRKSNAGRKPDTATALPLNGHRQPLGAGASPEPDLARLRKVREKEPSEQPLSDGPELNVPVGVDPTSLGKDAAYLWIVAGQLIFGAEWAPDSHPDGQLTQEGRTEFNALRDGFAGYFKSKGVTHIDPGWGLAIVLVVYTAKRAQKPTIRTKLGGMFGWVKEHTMGAFKFFRRG